MVIRCRMGEVKRTHQTLIAPLGKRCPLHTKVNVMRTNIFNVYPLRSLRLVCGEQEMMGLLRPSQKLRTGLTHPTLAICGYYGH